MAKKTAKKETKVMEAPVELPPIPQLTFTEEEHKDLVEFANGFNKFCVYKEIPPKDSHKMSQSYIKFINHIKKVESHIFEFKKTTMKKKAN